MEDSGGEPDGDVEQVRVPAAAGITIALVFLLVGLALVALTGWIFLQAMHAFL